MYMVIAKPMERGREPSIHDDRKEKGFPGRVNKIDISLFQYDHLS